MEDCKLCGGVGMVKTMDIESGGWERCPICEEKSLLKIAGVDPPSYYPDPVSPPHRGWWTRLKRWYQARFRTNLDVVCEESKAMGLADYHDYPDTELKTPFHIGTDFCVRCGKEFSM